MDVFHTLKNFLTRSASDGNLRQYRDRSLFMFSLNTSTPDMPEDFTKEQLLDAIRKNAKETSNSGDLSPFTYEQDGAWIVPFFSSPEAAQTFVQHGPFTTATFLTMVELNGLFLLEYLQHPSFSDHQIILNPRTEQEQTITQAQLRSALQ